jgi:large subunit ribosomal protein L1
MPKLAKRLRSAAETIEKDKVYQPTEALGLVKDAAKAKFDETIEVAFKLGVDPRKADQMVRGTVSLPAGTGKTTRVAVFASGDAAKQAEEAGADVVGSDELIEQVGGGWFEFDAAVATPDMMPKVGKIGKLLGPRGLMPNPKAGTVTPDVAKAVRDIKGGKVEYRTDKFGNVHLVLGKASFAKEDLVRNYAAVLDEIVRAKPSAAKGKYIHQITLSSTMGPGVKVDPQAVIKGEHDSAR